MARFTVYLSDELYRRAREELPDTVSLSRILADGVAASLACPHKTVVCQSCHVELPGADYEGNGGHCGSAPAVCGPLRAT